MPDRRYRLHCIHTVGDRTVGMPYPLNDMDPATSFN